MDILGIYLLHSQNEFSIPLGFNTLIEFYFKTLDGSLCFTALCFWWNAGCHPRMRYTMCWDALVTTPLERCLLFYLQNVEVSNLQFSYQIDHHVDTSSHFMEVLALLESKPFTYLTPPRCSISLLAFQTSNSFNLISPHTLSLALDQTSSTSRHA